MRTVGTAVTCATILVGVLGLGIYIGWGANELTYLRTQNVKSCDCRPCPCSQGRRTGTTGQPTGDTAPDEKGGDL